LFSKFSLLDKATMFSKKLTPILSMINPILVTNMLLGLFNI